MSTTTFTNCLRAETIKAFSTRTMVLSLAATTAIALASVAALGQMIAGQQADPVWSAYGLLATGIPILLVWAASVFFGEIGNSVLRTTYLCVPRRGVVFLAKAMLAAVVSVIAVMLLLPASHAVAAAVLRDANVLTYLGTWVGLWLFARLAFAVACWAVIAVSVAAITRHLALSVGIVVSFYLFLEAYLGDIPGAEWIAYVLPFSSGKALVPEVTGVMLENPGWAGVGQVAVATVIASLACFLTIRRDAK